MKFSALLLLLFVNACAFSQSLEIRAGNNAMPGNYLSVGYEHYSNYVLNFSGRVFAEGSKVKGLQYRAYGVNMMAEYGSNQDPTETSIFSFRVGFGANGQIESEPWIYSNLKTHQRITYGLVGSLSGEWWMSENFCLSVFGEQKWLFHTAMGNTRSAFGLGLKFRLSNY